MLYSQEKERSQRFWLALRISVPFIFVLYFWIYILLKIEEYEYIDISMFLLLSLIYVYFTFYMIYQGFKTTLIDQTTKTFSKEKIFEIIKKSVKKSPKNLVLIGIKNLNDINERYGIEITDEILREFAVKLEEFLIKKNITKTPIGRYFSGYFLFVLDLKINQINHILKEFDNKTLKNGIKNIELNIAFGAISSDFGSDLKSTISTLYYTISNKKINFNIFSYEKAIISAIDAGNFSFKFQKIRGKNGDFIALTPRLNFESQNLPKFKISAIINKIGYEIKYDLKMLDLLFKSVNFSALKTKIFIEISPVSLRNNEFSHYFFEMINSYKIPPQKIIFEFFEPSFYAEIGRFKEIIKRYREAGFCFALSHFGGRNSSFEYFKHLDIDFIIFDLEFSKNLVKPKFAKIVKNIENLAQNFGVKTLLRFIDKAEILEAATALEIDLLQGFCIEKPKNKIGEIL